MISSLPNLVTTLTSALPNPVTTRTKAGLKTTLPTGRVAVPPGPGCRSPVAGRPPRPALPWLSRRGATDLARLIDYNGATASSRPQTVWPNLPHAWRNLTGRRQILQITAKTRQKRTRNPTFLTWRTPGERAGEGGEPRLSPPRKCHEYKGLASLSGGPGRLPAGPSTTSRPMKLLNAVSGARFPNGAGDKVAAGSASS